MASARLPGEAWGKVAPLCRGRPCEMPQQPATSPGGMRGREWTLPRDKTRVTRGSDGCDCIGFQVVKRQSPRSGKNTISLLPAKSAQQKIRTRRKSLTSRRAPSSPKACGAMGNPSVTGGNSCRHPNASQACRGLQRLVNSRLRRYVTQRSKGRGLGWRRSPNSKLDARGRVDMGSGRLEYVPKPAPGGR